jgi:hypothetical protein
LLEGLSSLGESIGRIVEGESCGIRGRLDSSEEKFNVGVVFLVIDFDGDEVWNDSCREKSLVRISRSNWRTEYEVWDCCRGRRY